MNFPQVFHLVGALLGWIGVAMLPPTIFAAMEGQLLAWLGALALTMAAGALLFFITPREISLHSRDGVAVVGLGWLAVVTAGSLPFILTGTAPTVAAAFFESASGFTTTGATVFPVIEELPRSILLWRSISHWIGGMGIIVLGVAILPLLGVGGAQLFRAEVPGISPDRLQPRIATTARLLWGVYVLFTGSLAAIYLLLGMPVFDAANHAMSALATGGFSTRTASLGAYSPTIQWVTVFFMLVAGTNFTLHFRLLTGRWRAWFRDAEWRWYAFFTGASVVATLASLVLARGEWGLATVREAVFNVTAIVTTTGFATADFALWPAFAQVVLLALMFMGAMGGSTGGGFKVVRAVVVAKHAAGEIRKILHPRAVFVNRLGPRVLKPEVVLNVMAFLALYMGTHALGTFALTAFGNDIVTSLSASLAAISSIGPGLAEVGPAGHYGIFSWPEHLILAGLMLLGRLEFYTLLVLFLPGLWTRLGGRA